MKRVSKLLLSLAYWCATRPLAWFGAGSLCVITYHQVSPKDATRFARQLRAAKRAGTLVFADDTAGANCGKRRLAVTFDDFFDSALQVALPLLRQHAIVSTWFVPTGFVGGTPEWIGSRSQENRNAKIGDESVLRQLDPQLVRVGSHTVFHPRLPALGAQESLREIRDSKIQLTQLSGNPVDLLSFPYGEYSRRELEVAERCGYKLVYTNVPVRMWGAAEGILRGRVPVDVSDWALEFWLKLRGGYNWLAVGHWLRHRSALYPEPRSETALA